MSQVLSVPRRDPNEGLQSLGEQVRADLETLDAQPSDWVRPRLDADGSRLLDAVVVGAGQSGLGAAFALRRERLRHILVLDESEAGYEGPWETYARMVTLRTPKHLTGIDGGVPSLTFRAWWEAQHGPAAWQALDKIPRGEWMNYLRWFRAVLDLPVRNGARVTLVEPVSPGLHRLTLASGETLLARKVIFATGIQGGGEWHAPPMVKALPKARYAHTSEAIDFETLRGRRLAILGGGASAFDNAQHALGLGAAEVHVFVRRPELPRINPIRHMEVSGIIRHFAALSDGEKYAALDHFLRLNQPPTNDTFQRASAYPGFELHLGEPWTAVLETEGGARVVTPKGEYDFDFLILSTGLLTDVALRPELSAVAGDIALWRDRFTPTGGANALIDQHPYLGPGFEFLARDDEGQSRLHGLFAFNYSALASLGLSAAALSGLKVALPKLAEAVARQLFLDDREAMLGDYLAYDQQEFVG